MTDSDGVDPGGDLNYSVFRLLGGLIMAPVNYLLDIKMVFFWLGQF